MRNLLLAAAVGAVASIGMTPTSVQARNYPFCIKGDFYPSWDCRFDTYQQCLASASGTRAYCDANYYYYDYPRKPHRQHVRADGQR